MALLPQGTAPVEESEDSLQVLRSLRPTRLSVAIHVMGDRGASVPCTSGRGSFTAALHGVAPDLCRGLRHVVIDDWKSLLPPAGQPQMSATFDSLTHLDLVSTAACSGHACGVQLEDFAAVCGLAHLQALRVCQQIQTRDAAHEWAQALRNLPSGLTSLSLGPLCHLTELAAAVASWGDNLPGLERLQVELMECSHSHPDLEAALYEDPAAWSARCWDGVFRCLVALTSLTVRNTRACGNCTQGREAAAIAYRPVSHATIHVRHDDRAARCGAHLVRLGAGPSG
jgi:hypothetical protein